MNLTKYRAPSFSVPKQSWPDITAEQYAEKGECQVTGQISGTDLEATAAVKVLSGNEDTMTLIFAVGIAAGILVAAAAVIVLRKRICKKK